MMDVPLQSELGLVSEYAFYSTLNVQQLNFMRLHDVLQLKECMPLACIYSRHSDEG